MVQTLVRWHEPDLPESQIIDLAADLVVGTSMYYEEVWGSVFVSGQPDSRTFAVETGSMPYFTESERSDPDADVTADTGPTWDDDGGFLRVKEPFKKERAREFTALLEAEGLPGVDVDDRAIVPSAEAQVFEWVLLTDAVEGRLQVSEFGVSEYTDRTGWSLTLLVDEGRGSAAGDAYIAAAVRAMVQMHQPDLDDSTVTELVTNLTAGDHTEQVGATVFTSTVTDGGIVVEVVTMTE